MRFQHPTEAGIALALALTLAVKFAFAPSMASTEASIDREASVAAFLENEGFVVGAHLPNTDPPMLPAKSADCSLRIVEVSPSGWHRDVLAQLALPGEQVLFVYRGNTFPSQPIWQTFLDHNWRRLLAYAGLRPPERPVFGILASPTCALQELPWAQLAEFG